MCKEDSRGDMKEVVPARGDSFGLWLYVSYNKPGKRGNASTAMRMPNNANNMKSNGVPKIQVSNTKTQGLPKTQTNTVKSKGDKAEGSPKFSKGDNAGISSANGAVAPSKSSIKMGKPKLSSAKFDLQGTGGSRFQVLEGDVDVLLEDISKGPSSAESANLIFSKPWALFEITNTKCSLCSGSKSSKKITSRTTTGKKGGGKSKGKTLTIHPVPIDVMEEANVHQLLHCDVIATKNREIILSKRREMQMQVDNEQAPCVEDGPADEEIVDVAVVTSNLNKGCWEEIFC
ncbi:hypothetical protein ACOSQ3_010219 [Xanthoceras sorbifolium]